MALIFQLDLIYKLSFWYDRGISVWRPPDVGSQTSVPIAQSSYYYIRVAHCRQHGLSRGNFSSISSSSRDSTYFRLSKSFGVDDTTLYSGSHHTYGTNSLDCVDVPLNTKQTNLRGRLQCVRYDGRQSEYKLVYSGVPRGSVSPRTTALHHLLCRTLL